MPTQPLSYVVITPVRDEARYIAQTIQAMIAQTALPQVWVIVDDGSRDATAAIVQAFANEHPWIHLRIRADRGARQRGKGVVEAFYVGYHALEAPADCIVKLDGDVSFGPDYFAALLEQFAADPALGIAGGGVYERPEGDAWKLYTIRDHVRGATKIYRSACFQAIGGLSPSMGWDGIDEWKALAHGWKVQSFVEIPMYHYRFTGAATGFLKSNFEQGLGAYRMGYHPLYLLARALRRMSDRPPLLSGLAMIAGYACAWLKRETMLADPEVVRFVRRTQLQKLKGLLAGKPVY